MSRLCRVPGARLAAGVVLVTLVVLVVVACVGVSDKASRGRARVPRAELAVELWSGFTQPAAQSAEGSERVEILLDLTTSMRATPPRRPPRYAAARSAAVRLLRSLGAERSVGLRALGVTKGEEECAGVLRLQRSSSPGDPDVLARQLDSLRPTAEGSLAGALDQIAGELGPGLAGTRVVVFSDLGTECGGDLCAAAGRVASAGARLDLVLFSEAEVPECLAELSPEGEPRLAALAPAALRRSFRVEAHETGSKAVGDVLARGRVDGTPTRVPAGAATVVLEIDPPSVIGPLELEEGTLTRVRVLDFPSLDPPTREWQTEVAPLEPEPAKP